MPMVAGTAPAKSATPRQSSVASKGMNLAQDRIKARADGLNSLFQTASVALLMRKQLADAAAIAEHGPNISLEAAKVAEQNAQFAKVLEYLTAVGPYTGLMTATLPLVLQLMANHNRIDAGQMSAFGVIPPEALRAKAEAEAKKTIAEYQAQAALATQEANEASKAVANAAASG
jgi:hypothetical protein